MEGLILCKNITCANKGAGILNSGGIDCRIQRPPEGVGPKSCAYAISVDGSRLKEVVALLKHGGFGSIKLWVSETGGYHRKNPSQL